MQAVGRPLIITRDFNAKNLNWGYRAQDVKGRSILELDDQLDLNIIINGYCYSYSVSTDMSPTLK